MCPFRTVILSLVLVVLLGAFPGTLDAWAQDAASPFTEQPAQELHGEGWTGFADVRFLANLILSLLLATLLGAVIAYHPRHHRQVDSLEDVQRPKIFLIYAVVGAVIGTMVLQYGLVVGLVVFGIGGLMRFRTNVGSATTTGRLIFVTLIGLCSGLDLPHVAVIATAFGFVLIYLVESRQAYRMLVQGLRNVSVREASDFYRSVLEQQGCRILSEQKNFDKATVAFIFRTPYALDRDDLEYLFEIDVPEPFRGTVDWEIG